MLTLRIKELVGRNQGQIAAELGVSRETVNRWLNGHHAPQGPNLVGLLSVLRQFDPDLTLDDLFAETPESEEKVVAHG